MLNMVMRLRMFLTHAQVTMPNTNHSLSEYGMTMEVEFASMYHANHTLRHFQTKPLLYTGIAIIRIPSFSF